MLPGDTCNLRELLHIPMAAHIVRHTLPHPPQPQVNPRRLQGAPGIEVDQRRPMVRSCWRGTAHLLAVKAINCHQQRTRVERQQGWLANSNERRNPPFLAVHNPTKLPRSEERRVGKERRSRWSPYHSKKNT